MQTLGDYLKNSREAQNISLSDVADYTKISKMYLDYLENDDYAKIPAKLYVKGYISSYASFVGIDENEALKLYYSFQNETDDVDVINSEILQNKKNSKIPYLRLGNKFWLFLSFCVLVIASMAAYNSFFQNQTETMANSNREERAKPLQQAVNSTIKTEVLQNGPDDNSFSSRKQTALNQKIDHREVRKNQINGISKSPAPLKSHKPEPNSKVAAAYPPTDEVVKVKDLTGSENVKTILENNFTGIEVTACTGIKNRNPQGIGDTFDWSIDRVYIWSRITSESPPASFRHIYYFKGKKVNDVLLKIRSSHWRTWSFKTLSNQRYIGQWRVDIASAEGKVLKSINFEIR
jgi:cytoskeletal protein RodZ